MKLKYCPIRSVLNTPLIKIISCLMAYFVVDYAIKQAYAFDRSVGLTRTGYDIHMLILQM